MRQRFWTCTHLEEYILEERREKEEKRKERKKEKQERRDRKEKKRKEKKEKKRRKEKELEAKIATLRAVQAQIEKNNAKEEGEITGPQLPNRAEPQRRGPGIEVCSLSCFLILIITLQDEVRLVAGPGLSVERRDASWISRQYV